MIAWGESFAGLAYGSSVGIGIGGSFLIFRWIVTFVAGQWRQKEEQLDASTRLLIEQLEHRLNNEIKNRETVEAELRRQLGDVGKALEECQKQHADARKEVMELRGAIQGYGNANQHAQLIIAADHAKHRGEDDDAG